MNDVIERVYQDSLKLENQKEFRVQFIEDLNGALKDTFDYVPLEYTIKVAEHLFRAGWNVER